MSSTTTLEAGEAATATAASHNRRQMQSGSRNSAKSMEEPESEPDPDRDKSVREHKGILGRQNLTDFCLNWMAKSDNLIVKSEYQYELFQSEKEDRKMNHLRLKLDDPIKVTSHSCGMTTPTPATSNAQCAASAAPSKGSWLNYMQSSGLLDVEEPEVSCLKWVLDSNEHNPDQVVRKDDKLLPTINQHDQANNEEVKTENNDRLLAKSRKRTHRPTSSKPLLTVSNKMLDIIFERHRRRHPDRYPPIPFEIIVRNFAYDRGLRLETELRKPKSSKLKNKRQ